MRFILLLFCFAQISAAVIVREETSDGFWLEARINDDRTLAELIFSDGSSVVYDYEDARLQKISRYWRNFGWRRFDVDGRSD